MAINYNEKGNLNRIYYNNTPVYQLKRKSDNKIMWVKPYRLTSAPGYGEVESPRYMGIGTNVAPALGRTLIEYKSTSAANIGYCGCLSLGDLYGNGFDHRIYFSLFKASDEFEYSEMEWDDSTGESIIYVEEAAFDGYIFACKCVQTYYSGTEQFTRPVAIRAELVKKQFNASYSRVFNASVIEMVYQPMKLDGSLNTDWGPIKIPLVISYIRSDYDSGDFLRSEFLAIDISGMTLNGQQMPLDHIASSGTPSFTVRHPTKRATVLTCYHDIFDLRVYKPDLAIERWHSEEPTASSSNISLGDTIYAGDVLYDYESDEMYNIGCFDRDYYNIYGEDTYQLGTFTLVSDTGSVVSFKYSGDFPIIASGVYTLVDTDDKGAQVTKTNYPGTHYIGRLSTAGTHRDITYDFDTKRKTNQWISETCLITQYYGEVSKNFTYTRTNPNYTSFSAPVVNVKSSQEEDTAGAMVTWYSGSATNTNAIPVKMETIYTFYYKNGTTTTSSETSILDPGYQHTNSSGGNGNIVGLKIVSYAYAFGTNKMSSQSIGNTSGGGGEEDTEEETT